MIVDAILLSLAKIMSTQKKKIVIFPEMRIARGAGVQISHPSSGYELWLTGSVDYAVIEYEDVSVIKSESDYPTPSLPELPYIFLRTLPWPWWIQGRSI